MPQAYFVRIQYNNYVFIGWIWANVERLNQNMCYSIDIVAMQIADSVGVE